jgi:hypothetical protein
VLEEQTRPTREVVGGKIGAAARVVGKAASKVAEQPAVQAVGRATMAAIDKTIEAQDKLDKTTQEWEKRMLESQGAKKVREALGEDPRGKGPVQGVAIDKETTDISIYQETAWERRVRKLKESAFLGPIMGGSESLMDAASEVSNRLGDRVFGETETALCMAEIKKDDPTFNTRTFLKKLETVCVCARKLTPVCLCTMHTSMRVLYHSCIQKGIRQPRPLMSEGEHHAHPLASARARCRGGDEGGGVRWHQGQR